MDVTTNHAEGIGAPSFMQPPDANDCAQLDCPNCEKLKDQLRKLSYCLAVAQRLTNTEAGG